MTESSASSNIRVHFVSQFPDHVEAALAVVQSAQAAAQAITAVDDTASGWVLAALNAEKFAGKPKQRVSLFSPASATIKRFIVCAPGKLGTSGLRLQDGVAAGLGAAKCQVLGVMAQQHTAEEAARMAQAVLMASYKFDKYKSEAGKKRKSEDADGEANGDDKKLSEVYVLCGDAQAATHAFADLASEYEGIAMARDLVIEPPNVLSPESFAQRLDALKQIGLTVETFDTAALEKMGAGSLLAVAQGSKSGGFMTIMRWNGAGDDSAPVAVVGKGVTFDTGGISLKPPAKMDEMKGDMGGAAAVAGVMRTLALRKAPINVVGCVGLVENMPSGTAMRPGDVLTSLSGQTIEVGNTDAEGRLVLADVLTYVQREFSPRAIVDLATLTGACMVALGKVRAGMFSNDDTLAAQLSAAGELSGEKVWRLPLDEEYDKLIASKVADVHNVGADRYGGAITAAKFLQRFVEKGTKWAHLDIAGVAMAHSASPTSPGWASGFGVRLLNTWIATLQDDAS